ncbi:unnamed protein product [Bursaphelenchus xylophilus]|uniref:(pine wood nematode) hypothetical protein n=1 Tax=Bursaphelenchus xylophilus TaxID=6326 RepID=A0A1I7RV59_BURXY|nr:unnamed protein product [Bursaphelenchus xylophilus]CAG9105072.1 unnamed protein product [Bursaphelenchus xylophilus]
MKFLALVAFLPVLATADRPFNETGRFEKEMLALAEKRINDACNCAFYRKITKVIDGEVEKFRMLLLTTFRIAMGDTDCMKRSGIDCAKKGRVISSRREYYKVVIKSYGFKPYDVKFQRIPKSDMPGKSTTVNIS